MCSSSKDEQKHVFMTDPSYKYTWSKPGVQARMLYETLRKECFVEKSVRFSSLIHWTNLKTFLSIHKHEKENKGKSSGTTKEDAQIRRSTEIACAQGRTMEELFQYDISSTPYLFVENLMMTKPQKSALVQDLETKLTNDDEKVPAQALRLTQCV